MKDISANHERYTGCLCCTLCYCNLGRVAESSCSEVEKERDGWLRALSRSDLALRAMRIWPKGSRTDVQQAVFRARRKKPDEHAPESRKISEFGTANRVRYRRIAKDIGRTADPEVNGPHATPRRSRERLREGRCKGLRHGRPPGLRNKLLAAASRAPRVL